MFIEQAFKSLHDTWRYLLGTFIIFFAWMIIGQGPLTLVLLTNVIKSENSTIPTTTAELIKNSGISSNLFLFLLLLSFAVGLLGIWFVVKYLHRQKFKELTTCRKRVDWKRIFFSFGLMGIFILASTAASYYLYPENFIVQFDLIPFLVLFFISILFIPLQIAFEEYLFRGYLMQGLGIMAGNRLFPLLVTSVIFGGLHFLNPEVEQFGVWIMAYYIGTGLFLGVLTLMDDGLELALGFHAANNLLAILLITADWTVFQSHSILKEIKEPEGIGSELLTSLVILYPILLFVFSKKYKWKNWKEKLTGRVVAPEPNV